jgi:predicted ester cyclase
VTTYKTYYGTHDGPFLGIAPTHRKIHFESVDVMRVQNGKITDHWGVGNLLSLMHQIGGWNPPAELKERADRMIRRFPKIKK